MYRQEKLAPSSAPSHILPSRVRCWVILFVLIAALAAIFVLRTLLSESLRLPRLFEIAEALTTLVALGVIVRGRSALIRNDWLVGIAVGVALGTLVQLATLFNPYPFWDRWDGLPLHGIARSSFAAIASLCGIVVMRWGGPVQFRMARGEWRRAVAGFGFGAVIGVPLAILNLLANAIVQGRSIAWQNPLAAAIDALQPAVLEEVVYRFALLGILWLLLRGVFPKRAPQIAAILVILVHSYGHYSELFVQAPLAALGMGALLAVIWGIPLAILALRRDLETAIGFHWMQDALRFWGGL